LPRAASVVLIDFAGPETGLLRAGLSSLIAGGESQPD